MKEDLVSRFNLDPSRLLVIYPEVNLSGFNVDNPGDVKRIWREKLGIPQSAFVFGMVTSGNHKKRNLDLLIEAFKSFHKKHPQTYLFVGGGKVDEHYQSMISKNVTFAPTLIDVKNYFYLLDVFVLPAHIEEFGISVLEAMYCEIPVITSSTVGAAEIIEGVGREMILDELNEEQLVIKMEKLLNEDLYHAVKKSNKLTANKFNSLSKNEMLQKVLLDLGVIRE